MTDMTYETEAVALAICNTIVQQDDEGFSMPAGWGCKIAYLDQGEVDFAPVAQAAITTLDRHRIERAGDVEQRLLKIANDVVYDETATDEALVQAAALIASLRAENARARQEGWNAAIEAAAGGAIEGRNYWRDKCDATKARRESRDYETMAIACVHIEHAIRALASDAKEEG